MTVIDMWICIFALGMKTFVIGNPITRGFLDPEWQMMTLSGANWYELIEYVMDKKDRFQNSIICMYIHIGPVRFSELVFRIGRGTQCRLRSKVATRFQRWRQQLFCLNKYPVLCTLFEIQRTLRS